MHRHIWWSCPWVSSFWRSCFHIISNCVGTEIYLDASVAFLKKKPPYLTKAQFQLLINVTAEVKQTIAKAWKSPSFLS